MKSSRYSSNKIKALSGQRQFPFLILTAVLLIILSFLLKTAGEGFLIISAVLFTLVAVFVFVTVKNKGLAIMLLILTLFCLRSVAIFNNIERLNTLDGINDTIEVTVIAPDNTPEQDDFGSCTVRVNNSLYLKKNTKICLLTKGAQTLELGDELSVSVTYQKIYNQNRHSFYSEGIYLEAVADAKHGTVKKQKGIYGLAGNLREHINSRIFNNTDNAHVLMAVITGERGYMSNKFYDTVKAAGVSHILVVSGMHLAIITIGIERILRLIFKNEILKNAVLLSFVFFMCILCGMSMSVIRAGIVYLVRAIYKILGRNSDNIHCLAFAVMTVVLIHPFALYSVVFQLSYASTFGILVLPQLFDDKFKKYTEKSKVLRGIANTLYVSLSAYILTFPICVAQFGYVSVVSILVNLLVSLATTFMLVFCVLAVVFGFVPFLEKLFFIIADMLADYFVKVVDFFGNLSFSTVELRNPQILTALLIVLYLAVYIILFKPYKFLKRGGKIAGR